MAQNPLVGTWRLVSCETRTSEGQVSHPFGQHPAGYIIYSDDGYVSVAIMAERRWKFAAGDISGGTEGEKIAAANTYLSYCGRYEMRGGNVVHHVEVSFFPNWVGVDQERTLALDGKRLSLSTPPFLVGGMLQTSYLIWERVSAI